MQPDRKRLLKRHGLVYMKFEGEQARVITERCQPFIEIALHQPHILTSLERVIQQVAHDCYLQGAMDGASLPMLIRLKDAMK